MRTLIAYFSWSGNTKKLVDGIREKLDCDVARIERAVPYSDDYHTCAYVEAKKEAREKVFPEIAPINANFNEYDRILLFFPIWWYTYPMPVATFARLIQNFNGEVFVFANSYTNDPMYMANSMRDLKSVAPRVKFSQGLFNKSLREHIYYLIKGE